MKLFFLGALLGIGLCGAETSAFGATINVANFGDGTPSLANAQSAYNAAATGDTIMFPGGTATWSASLMIGKAVTLVGNGTTLIAGTTLINGFFCATRFISDAPMRITGFTFNMVNLASGGHGILVSGGGVSLSNLRIDHNIFHHGEIQLEVGGSKGVVDHNSFYNGMSAVYFTAGTRAQADASWASMTAGTGDALFFEDNQFIHDMNWLGAGENNSAFDTYNGGKLVIRYNSFIATNVPASWTGPYGVLELHGSAGAGAAVSYWQADSGANRGQSIVEMYNNTIKAKRVDFLAKLRGSSNLIHDNTLDTQTYTPRLIAYEEEASVSQWTPLRTEWPAEDQVHNSFFWNNTLRLNGFPNPDYFTGDGVWIKEGRDYFMHAPQATGGKEVFTGLNGASGTYPTDGTKYRTLGTMTFTPDGPNAYYPYTPYTYPHPSTASPAPKPAPPTNLRVQE